MADFQYDRVVERILSRNRWGSEKDLASALGVSPNTWTSWKRGKSSFGLHEVAKICDILDVTPKWLLFGEESQEQDMLRDQVKNLVFELHEAAKIHLPDVSLQKTSDRYYSSLQAEIVSQNDIEELGMRMHLLRKRIEKDIATAVAAPGSGKRSAS